MKWELFQVAEKDAQTIRTLQKFQADTFENVVTDDSVSHVNQPEAGKSVDILKDTWTAQKVMLNVSCRWLVYTIHTMVSFVKCVRNTWYQSLPLHAWLGRQGSCVILYKGRGSDKVLLFPLLMSRMCTCTTCSLCPAARVYDETYHRNTTHGSMSHFLSKRSDVVAGYCCFRLLIILHNRYPFASNTAFRGTYNCALVKQLCLRLLMMVFDQHS